MKQQLSWEELEPVLSRLETDGSYNTDQARKDLGFITIKVTQPELKFQLEDHGLLDWQVNSIIDKLKQYAEEVE